MAREKKAATVTELSNPFSTGSGGAFFENHVQAGFVVLMLTGGTIPCLPHWPLVKIKLQGKYDGFETDDFIAFVESDGKKAKLLAQIKHTIKITKGDKTFGDVIAAAWRDFQNAKVFDPQRDRLVLITGPLSATDTQSVRELLEWARHCAGADEFLNKIEKANFSSKQKKEKLGAFREQLSKANGDRDVGDDQLWSFLKCFHFLGYDLDIKAGVTLSLLHSHIGQFTSDDIHGLWTRVADEVGAFNQNAGTITRETISDPIKARFAQRLQAKTMPAELLAPEAKEGAAADSQLSGEQADALMLASLIGAWDENQEGDREILGKVTGGDDAR